MLKLKGRAILPIWIFAFGVNWVQSESTLSEQEMGKLEQKTSQDIVSEKLEKVAPEKEQTSDIYHKKEVEIQPIPYEVKYEFHPEIKKGRIRISSPFSFKSISIFTRSFLKPEARLFAKVFRG